jgi:putative membrane protein
MNLGALQPQHLPPLNACLNGLAALFLLTGFYFIKRGNKQAHRNCMIAAFYTSTLFLLSYLTYHFMAGRTVFREPAWFRPIYLVILLTHTVLAVVILPMILATLYRAQKEQFDRHKKIARWTLPLWLYVSVTGVVIYYLLYVKFPQK